MCKKVWIHTRCDFLINLWVKNMACRFIISSHNPYMTSLIFWGFLNLLVRSNPEIINYMNIEGYSNSYIVNINVDESKCREVVNNINNTYTMVYNDIITKIKNGTSNAYKAWFAAYRASARTFLIGKRPQMTNTINVGIYLSDVFNPHVCTDNLEKPHVTISGSLGKWFWATGHVESRTKALESCNTCRSLAIVGLEYESIVIRSPKQGLIATISFEGTLHEEEVFIISGLLSTSSPWIKAISDYITPRVLDNMPINALPLIISTYLPIDLPLNINWYIICNVIGTGRTSEYGPFKLNEYIDFTNRIKALWPHYSVLISTLIKALYGEELATDAITLLLLLNKAAQLREPRYAYIIMREMASFIEKAKKLELEKYLNLGKLINLYDLAKALHKCS